MAAVATSLVTCRDCTCPAFPGASGETFQPPPCPNLLASSNVYLHTWLLLPRRWSPAAIALARFCSAHLGKRTHTAGSAFNAGPEKSVAFCFQTCIYTCVRG